MGNKPTVDIYLIMDDIIEKLSLLDYESSFCKGWKHKRISRIHFAHITSDSTREDEVARGHLLYDMGYWLMSMDRDKVSTTATFVDPHQLLLVKETGCVRQLPRLQGQDDRCT